VVRPPDPARDHAFHPLRVARVVEETADAYSYVLEVPGDLEATFRYQAGQFCTFRVVADGQTHARCYSMSSAPAVDAELRVTVKRVPGGVVSNWMADHLVAGNTIDVAPPGGVFLLDAGEADVVAFAGGSGITPVLSVIKTALATTQRRVRLLYANRDRDSIIFAAELDELVAAHPGRLEVVHHLDVESGFMDAGHVTALTGAAGQATGPEPTFYICGPTPFMDIAEGALLEQGVAAERIHLERFGPIVPPPTFEPPGSDTDDEPTAIEVTIELDGKVETTEHRPGTTLLQTARQAGLSPPFSCESGNCATCMGRLVEGTATMFVNNALTADEVDEGWVLTCQAVPTAPKVHVSYGFEG
jgi:ferredoxin-NADP reductase